MGGATGGAGRRHLVSQSADQLLPRGLQRNQLISWCHVGTREISWSAVATWALGTTQNQMIRWGHVGTREISWSAVGCCQVGTREMSWSAVATWTPENVSWPGWHGANRIRSFKTFQPDAGDGASPVMEQTTWWSLCDVLQNGANFSLEHSAGSRERYEGAFPEIV